MSSTAIRRPRQSPWTAVSMDEALKAINMNGGEREVIEINVANLQSGDVVAQEIRAKFPHPQFRTSRMDGYAFRAIDGIGDFKVLGGITAGSSARELEIPARHCFRINTGGVVPDDADAVIPVEYTKLIDHNDQEELVIEIQKEMQVGQNIREIGSDIPQNELLLPMGTQLAAGEIGLMVSAGYSNVRVYKRPTVSVLSTGDELVDISCATESSVDLAEGRIYDSNRPMLIEVLRSRGFQVRDAGIVNDKREAIIKKIREQFVESDVLVTSGGVSMGDKDLLKYVLQEDMNFKIHFGRVFMKPGLPSTFATGQINQKHCVVFGLPGNPVSAFVSSHLFVLPMLRHRSGSTFGEACGSTITVKLNGNVKLDSRPEYVRACFESNSNDVPTARIITSNQVSSRLVSVIRSNLLLQLPARTDEISTLKSGTLIDAIVIDML
ncbi:Gephyrin [Aphelenchoides besseyi]|nr:Gephyrin [Aphelenchoides besseyi]KAI6200258.1 Gephyrin [Aphelenchoides besseyi]